MNWQWEQIYLFGLIFLRLVAFMFTMIFIGTNQVPASVKILFSLVLSLFVFHQVIRTSISLGDAELLRLAIYQVLTGLFLGFVSQMLLIVLQTAAEWLGIASGLGSAQLFNPSLGAQASVLYNFFFVAGGLVFFSSGAHMQFIRELLLSFDRLPLKAFSSERWSDLGFWYLFFTQIVESGLKLAAPVVGVVLITNVLMGVMARVVPQLNIFVTSLQLTFLVSLGILFLMLPYMSDFISGVFTQSLGAMRAWR